MKNTGKLWLCLLLTVLIAALFAVGFAAAAEGESPEIVEQGYCGSESGGSNLTWTLDSEGTLTISGTGEMANNYGYYGNSIFYSRRSRILKLIVNSGVTSIGSQAFYDCAALTSVTLPDSVTEIHTSAFRGCTSLTDLTLPACMTSLGAYVFYNCTSLTSIAIPEGVTGISNLCGECTSLTSVRLPDSLTQVGESAFYGCTSLTGVVIPEHVTILGASAFRFCTSLTDVELPDCLTSIGNYAFEGCAALAEIVLPNSLTSIGDYTFKGCAALAEVVFPNGLKSVGRGVLDATAWYDAQEDGVLYYDVFVLGYKGAMPEGTNLVLGNTCRFVAPAAFQYQTGLMSVTIPGNIAVLGEYAFAGCTELTTVAIENGVTQIGRCAFSGCSRLVRVSLPASVTNLGQYQDGYDVFSSCDSLQEIIVDPNNPNYASDDNGCLFDKAKQTLICYPFGRKETDFTVPNGVTTIGMGVFENCETLRSVTLPNSLTWIDHLAFGMCSNLTSIDIPDGVTGIGENAFVCCGQLSRIRLPASITWIGDWAFARCDSLTDVYYGGSETQWRQVGVGQRDNDQLRNATFHYNVLAWGYCGTTIAGNDGTNLTWTLDTEGTVTISGTGEMDRYNQGESPLYAFRDQIQAAAMEPGVTSIGDNMFRDCAALQEVAIPDGVTNIGREVFRGCGALKSVRIPKTAKYISSGAFQDCVSLTTMRIPHGMIDISESQFEGCTSLKSVMLPITLNSIGRDAFFDCTALRDIYYAGSEFQRLEMSHAIKTGNFVLNQCVWHYNVEDWDYCGGEGDGTNLVWLLNKEGVLSVSGTGAMADAEESLPVWAGSECFDPETGEMSVPVKHIIFYPGVTTVSKNACSHAANLERVSISETVTSVDSHAFADCGALQDVCFAGSEAQWEQITVAAGNEPLLNAPRCYGIIDWGYCGAYDDKESVRWTLNQSGLLKITGAGRLDAYSEWDTIVNENVTAVMVEEGVTTIGMGAFASLPAASIVIPQSVTCIENSAFMNCENLQDLTILNPTLPLNWSCLPYHEGGIYSSGGGGPVICFEVTLHGYLGSTTAQQANSWPFVALCPAAYTHAVEKKEAVPSTCTEDGHSAGWYCTDCGAWLDGDVIAAGHKNTAALPETAPTATAHGHKAGVFCNDCQTWLSGGEVIHNHLGAQTIIKAPTDTEEGLIEIVCTVCGESGVYTASKTEPKPTDDGGDSDSNSNSSGGFWQKIQTFTKGVIKWFLQLFRWLGGKK